MGYGASNVANFKTKVIGITLTPTAAACDTGDVVANFQSFDVVSDVGGASAIIGTINYLILLDKDDKGMQLDVLFSDKQTAPVLGAENGPVTIDDDDAATIIGRVDTGATYVDLILSQIVVPSAFTPIPFSTANGSLYIGAVNRGAEQTWSTAGITIRLGLTIE